MRADGSIAPALIRFDEYASKSEREREAAIVLHDCARDRSLMGTYGWEAGIRR